MRTVTIFGSSFPRRGDKAYDDAYQLGCTLAKEGFAICNGGYGGTMAAAAQGARSAGGHTIGVTCKLIDRVPNEWITEEISTNSLETRLSTLVSRGDGYVMLPGGTGTLLELAYVLELMNKGFREKCPVVLYGDFWMTVLEPVKQLVGREEPGSLDGLFCVSSDPQDVVQRMRAALSSP